jgi:glutamine amidotransferase-like uncharacterized protein
MKMKQAASVVLIALASAALIACRKHDPPAILLFAGTGTSPNDVAAVKAIIVANRLDYAAVSSARLNAMPGSQLRASCLLIVPGGNFIEIGNGLSPAAVANIRSSVHAGLNYLGICAGAFFAGDSPFNALNLTSGVRFGFYAAENAGIRKAAIPITNAEGAPLESYWEDGPQLSGWGAVVAKYPDGTPAVVEGRSGAGWVVLAGIHPEAPENWRRGMRFTTPARAGHAYAATLIRGALGGTLLPHF